MNTVSVRNQILGDGIPKICVPIVAHTYNELENSLHDVIKTDYDLVEFRADFYFEDDAEALRLIREAVGDVPVIYTLRTAAEGGEIEISWEEYVKRILAAAALSDIADVQTGMIKENTDAQRIISGLHDAGTGVIGSWHCFSHTPEVSDITGKMITAQNMGFDITKAAVMPRNRGDVIRLIEASVRMLEMYADRPFITMSMGSLGRITRAAAAFTGSCITFGMARDGSAPGQIPASDLRRILKSLGHQI